MLDNAFDFIISVQGINVTYERNAGTESVLMRIAPSNYFRNLAAMEDIQIEGREFVISKKTFDESALTNKFPERGDVILNNDIENNSITEIKELFVLGKLVGYRVRTS